MARFFAAIEDGQKGDSISLSQEDIRHIVQVLRLEIGDTITVCDGQGTDCLCAITDIGGKTVSIKILSKEKNRAEPQVQITLYQGLPKIDKMELIIQKCVELGVHRIVPVAMERAVVKVKGKEEKKLERWQKISEAAAKQSGRGIIPQVGPIMAYGDAIADMASLDLSLMPYELAQAGCGIAPALRGFSGGSIGVIIGPEGGFSQKEYEHCLAQGVRPISLGRRILRTETAGFVALSIIMHELGEL